MVVFPFSHWSYPVPQLGGYLASLFPSQVACLPDYVLGPLLLNWLPLLHCVPIGTSSTPGSSEDITLHNLTLLIHGHFYHKF